MTFWIGVVIGVIVGANLGALMLALCMAANENYEADAQWNRGALMKRHSATRVMTRWARRQSGEHARTPVDTMVTFVIGD